MVLFFVARCFALAPDCIHIECLRRLYQDFKLLFLDVQPNYCQRILYPLLYVFTEIPGEALLIPHPEILYVYKLPTWCVQSLFAPHIQSVQTLHPLLLYLQRQRLYTCKPLNLENDRQGRAQSFCYQPEEQPLSPVPYTPFRR